MKWSLVPPSLQAREIRNLSSFLVFLVVNYWNCLLLLVALTFKCLVKFYTLFLSSGILD